MKEEEEEFTTEGKREDTEGTEGSRKRGRRAIRKICMI